jgi:hypothetical protein
MSSFSRLEVLMISRLIAPFVLAVPAFAGQVTYSASGSAPMTGGPGSLNATTVTQIPKFDSHLGRLTGVEMLGHGSMSGTIYVENLGSTPYFCDGGLEGGFDNDTFSSDWGWGLPAFDGTLDYGGSSGRTLDVSNYSLSSLCLSNYCQGCLPGGGSTCYSSVFDVSAHPDWADFYTGPGTFARSDSASLLGHITGGICDSSSLDFVFAVDATANWTITYTYDDFPARFCFFEADPMTAFGPTCPCTASSAGCANSQNPLGADLISVGNSSLGSDSFGLAAFGMGANTSCMFFQGSTATYSGTLFGDGRRCAGGTIIRLGIKQAAGGAASYPAAQDMPLHTKGQITQPGTFAAYQVWYRDASPTFCTPSTFNLTSAVATVWTP